MAERIALVTGSSRGIGLGIARRLLADGAVVWLTGRERSRLEEARASLVEAAARPASRSTYVFEGDLTRTDGIEACLAEIEGEHGGLDVLVLNLGSGSSPNELGVDRDEWLRMIALNLLGSVQTAERAVPLMEGREGAAVVFVSSIAGSEAIGAPIAYGAAKAGVGHAAKELARRLAPRGVRVNVVEPGNVYFPGGSWARKLEEEPEEVRAMLRRDVPMGRFGTPEEVASAVSFLASEEASFITGARLRVDGGQTRSL